MKVIIIDDNQPVRNGMAGYIRSQNLDLEEITTAADGEEALAILKSEPYDMVITDIRMPGISGIQLSERLKRDFHISSLILISAFDEFEVAQKAIELGVDKFILKPINEEKLKEIVEEINHLKDDLTKNQAMQKWFYGESFDNDFLKAFSERDESFISVFFENQLYDIERSGINIKTILVKLTDILQKASTLFPKDIVIESKEVFREKILNQADPDKAIDLFLNSFLSFLNSRPVLEEKQRHLLIRKIREYIESNYTNWELSLSLIASEFHLSEAYVCMLFKKIEKINITALIKQLRIGRAKEELAKPNLKIGEIADLVGYKDQRYFSRLFRKETGLSPRDYRDYYFYENYEK